MRSGFISMAIAVVLWALPAAAATDLTGAGATFPYPLYSKWFNMYGKEHGITINYQAIGSGGGIRQLTVGTVDFAGSDAPLTREEARAMRNKVLHIPTVAGAVAVVYHLEEVDAGLKLTSTVLADIYLGKIKRWDDRRIATLNPGVKLPGLPIAVVYRSDSSGTTFIFTSYLSAVSRAWSVRVGASKSVAWPSGIGGKGNAGVAGVVKKTPGAIGYVELAYATQNRLACAAIENRAGKFVEPSLAGTTAAAAGFAEAIRRNVTASIVNAPGEAAYPICGFTYLLVYQEQKDHDKGQTLAELLWWAIHDGQKEAAALLYAPLPPEVVKLNEQALRGITHKGRPVLR